MVSYDMKIQLWYVVCTNTGTVHCTIPVYLLYISNFVELSVWRKQAACIGPNFSQYELKICIKIQAQATNWLDITWEKKIKTAHDKSGKSLSQESLKNLKWKPVLKRGKIWSGIEESGFQSQQRCNKCSLVQIDFISNFLSW